ncbi:hypothetical protein GALMADRAFT_566958 [Galerina marginata CBS 339.88]|uniref:RRM domain-containing protein n=1 Tax=Galerina marginata (strain CBS 339.88) TaxID=685588 RepID=A0A067T4Q6_GALM3|nr:hypothetical protein GALMADRAFT_566958 [Galerina marginata CBS 339.88]
MRGVRRCCRRGGLREGEVEVRDPRRDKSLRRPTPFRVGRSELVKIEYEFDKDSTGPPPPTSILLTQFSPLTPNHALRRHFSQHGPVLSFEAQIDKENGSALGILFVRYATHEEARRCVEREHGRRGGIMGMGGVGLKLGEVEEWKVVLDGDGGKLKAVLRELEDRKRRDREDRRRGAVGVGVGAPVTNGVGAAATPAVTLSGTGTPASGMQSPAQPRKGSAPTTIPQRPTPAVNPKHPTLPPRPVVGPPPDKLDSNSTNTANNNNNNKDNSEKKDLPPIPPPKVNDALVKARAEAMKQRAPAASASASASVKGTTTGPASLSLSVGQRGRGLLPTTKYGAYQASPMMLSRSPSPGAGGESDAPAGKGKGPKSAADREREHQEVVRELAKSGHDHVKILGSAQLVKVVREEDVRAFFGAFTVDKVLKDHTGLYVTFDKAGTAHRATTVLAANQLAFQQVTLTAHPPPLYVPPAAEKTHWTESELLVEAQKMILEELKSLLEKDISDRIVQQDLKALWQEERSKGPGAREQKPLEKKGLKGLSFRRPKEVVEEKEEPEPELEDEEEEEEEVEELEVERPKKKRKTEGLRQKTARRRRSP